MCKIIKLAPLVSVVAFTSTISNQSLAAKSRLLEEIVVTAQKRSENAQDVPISIQAFSGDALDARGVDDPTDLQRITPGLTVTQAVGFTLIYLRGIGTDAFLLGDPSVAYYIDNIYFPFSQGLAQEFGDVERVEVLKGPQGTLFGRNAVGGAVSVHTEKPSFEEFYGSAEVAAGNYDTKKSKLSLNLPLTDWAALSLSGFYNERDFYQGSLIATPPKGLDPVLTRAIRARLQLQPSDNFDITLSALKYKSNGAGTLFQSNASPSLLASLAGITPQAGYNSQVDTDVQQTIDNEVYSLDANWSAAWFDVRLLASDQLIDTSAVYDYDGSPQPLVKFAGKSLFADVQSAELQFLSNNEVGPDWLKWIVGAYYFQSESGYDGGLLQTVAAVDNLKNAFDGLLATLPDIIGSPIGDTLGGLQGLLQTLPSGSINVFGQIGTESIAYYSQTTVDLNDWMSLTLGARYQEEERYIIEAYNAIANEDGSNTPIFPLNPDDNLRSHTTFSFSPKASLEFHPDFYGEPLIYLSYQEAVKSATFNPLKLLQEVDFVKPEETTAYELGVKGALFDGLVNYSAAIFMYEIENQHVQFVSLLNGGVVTFENAEEAEVKGADFDLTAQLLPNIVDDLVITLGGAYLDAKFTKFTDASGFDESTGIFSQGNDFSGNDITRSPKLTFSSTVSKTWAQDSGELEIAADYYYNSGFYYTSQNVESAEQESYDLVGARISYLYQPWNLRATVYGNNILDEYYSIGVLQADFGTNVSLGSPASYGVKLKWDF